MRNAFARYHGLGNDYLVVDPAELDFRVGPAAARALCDRHRGVGGDGLLALWPSWRADFGLRIWNPDGSEAEKSGNGLRIFARWLGATRRTRRRRFRVETRGGIAGVALRGRDRTGTTTVAVEMGRASFRPADLPCRLRARELLDRPLRAAGRSLRVIGVSVGNPHCVVFAEGRRRFSREDLLVLGPALERHRAFPRRCNVQLAWRTGPRALAILVWERGAGETLASGSSACAAAAAGVRRGLVGSPVAVRAPGGRLDVRVGPHFDLVLRGPVSDVATGRLAPDLVRALRRGR